MASTGRFGGRGLLWIDGECAPLAVLAEPLLRRAGQAWACGANSGLGPMPALTSGDLEHLP